jgi:ribosomal protein L11 methylase PrmA
MANIYAEVLVSLYQYFTHATSINGFLILSGITEDKEELVNKAFLCKKWVKRARNHTPPSEENSPGWVSLLLERTN